MQTRVMMSVETGKRQTGVVLLVGLIMLLLMTVVGLAAIRGSNLQETMAGNMRERQLNFQVAEAGLREGEAFIENQTSQDLEALAFNGSVSWQLPDMNQQGNQSALGLPQVDNWDQDDWAARAKTADVDLGDTNTGDPPQYLVERLDVPPCPKCDGCSTDVGSGCGEREMYRITSRSASAATNSGAVLQTVYRVR